MSSEKLAQAVLHTAATSAMGGKRKRSDSTDCLPDYYKAQWEKGGTPSRPLVNYPQPYPPANQQPQTPNSPQVFRGAGSSSADPLAWIDDILPASFDQPQPQPQLQPRPQPHVSPMFEALAPNRMQSVELVDSAIERAGSYPSSCATSTSSFAGFDSVGSWQDLPSLVEEDDAWGWFAETLDDEEFVTPSA